MFGKWEVRELKLFSKLISRLFPPESIKELERLYLVYLQYIQVVLYPPYSEIFPAKMASAVFAYVRGVFRK